MANYVGDKNVNLDDIMGSGKSGFDGPGTAGSDRFSSGLGNDTFVYELAAMGGSDRYSGGTGRDTVEFRLTAAEWGNAFIQGAITSFKAAVDARVLDPILAPGGNLISGSGYTPLSFGGGRSLTVLEAENVRVFANNVLVLGTAAPTTVGTVKEAGVDLAYAPLPGTPSVSGQMPMTDQNGNPIPVGSTWSFGGVNGAPFGVPDIYGGVGSGFSITSGGLWTYTLDNTDVDTQDLQNGDVRVLSFKADATFGTSTVFKNVTITVNGTNDIQSIVVTGTDLSVTERGGVANGLIGPDGDGAGGTMALTNVDNNPAATLPGSFEQTGSTTVAGKYGDLVVTLSGAQATSVGPLDLTNATWTYTLRNGDANVQALTGGQAVTDPIALPAGKFDGASNVITVSITGADDLATISAAGADLAVIEAGGIQNGTPGDPSAGGTFTQTDPDTMGPYSLLPLTNTPLDGGGNRVDNTSTVGKYGTFALNPTTGVWTYALDNTRDATQALQDKWDTTLPLPVGELVSATETLTVVSSTTPGATQTIVVNIFGRDDLTQSITNTYGSAGPSVLEENEAVNKTADGLLTRVDIDGTHPSFFNIVLTPTGPLASTPGNPITVVGPSTGGPAPAPQTYVGQYGDFVLTSPTTGSTATWVYTRKDTAGYLDSDALITGQTATDVMVVKSNDDGAFASIAVTIIGQDDPSVIFADDYLKDVVEAGGPRVNTIDTDPIASGIATSTDPDLNQSGWTATSAGSLTGKYGNFLFNFNTGAWSYTLRNADANVEALTASEVVSDKLSLTSKDGTTGAITVTVVGSNDHAIISVTPVPDLEVKEAGGVANGTLFDPNASGDLNVVDVDGVGPFNESSFRLPTADDIDTTVLTDQAGKYGNFSFNATTGTWTYLLNNFDSTPGIRLNQLVATQALPDGVTVTDTMVVYSQDLSASTAITVNVTGSFDVAAITNVPVGAGVTGGSEVRAEGTRRTVQADPTSAVAVTADYLAQGDLNPIPPPVGPTAPDVYNVPAAAQLIGIYGRFTFNSGNGTWSYTLDNEDPDTLALLSKADGSKSAQDFLAVSNTAVPSEVYTIAVDVYGAFTKVDLKGKALPAGLLQTPNTTPSDLVPNAAPVVNGVNGNGSITFIARNGDPGETLSLHAGNPLSSLPLGLPWGTVTVNDGTLTTVTMPISVATNHPNVINQILHVWDGDTQTASPSAALSLGLSIAQGTVDRDTIIMIQTSNGGMASGYDDNDYITGTNSNDFIDGGRGEDTLTGDFDQTQVLGGNDTIRGGDGRDDIVGNKGDDVLWGDAGDDTLAGDNGNDTLIGGLGRDLMQGGLGDNKFFFGNGPFNSASEDDNISDFFPSFDGGADKLWFAESLLLTTGYNNNTGVFPSPPVNAFTIANPLFQWFETTTAVDIAAENYGVNTRFVFDGDKLYYDADGGGFATNDPVLVTSFDTYLTTNGFTLRGNDFQFDSTGP